MTVPRERRKRKWAFVVVLLPAIIFLWIVGWSLYWIGHQRESRKPQFSSSPKDEDHVRLMPMVLEDLIEITS